MFIIIIIIIIWVHQTRFVDMDAAIDTSVCRPSSAHGACRSKIK
jgi:hypothetical protein